VVSKRAGEFAPQTDTGGGLLTPVRAAATNQTYIKAGGSLRHRSQRDRLAPVNGNVDRGRAARRLLLDHLVGAGEQGWRAEEVTVSDFLPSVRQLGRTNRTTAC
jgi:hypothetical protein